MPIDVIGDWEIIGYGYFIICNLLDIPFLWKYVKVFTDL